MAAKSPMAEETGMAAADITCFRDYLEFLEHYGQFIIWPEPVLPEQGIRDVAVALQRDSMTGPAMMFDQIRGYPGKRLVINAHGSFSNIALSLGYAKSTTIKELFFKLIDRWGSDKPLIDWVAPEDALVHENRVEDEINLYDLLPLYRINEYDGGFYIAKANVVSRDPLDPDNFDKQNVGIYRIQVHGPDCFSVLSSPLHDLARMITAAETNELPLKIAVSIGNHPAMAMFAATPINYDESEYSYATQMFGSPIELTKSGNNLDILAKAEMVIEAELLPNERVLEGPFGEFPGSYSGVRRVPMFKATAVSHRNDPIFENIYIGRGWTEHDTLIGLNTCAPIYSQLKARFPEVVAVNALYQHGLSGIISVKNRYAGFAKVVAMAAVATPHGSMYLKNIILVDEFVDPFDLNEVMWALSTRTRTQDIIVIPNMPLIQVDPAAEVSGKGHRLIIDATGFMAPDIINNESRLVTPPLGEEIDALFKKIKILQSEAIKQ